MDTPQHNETTCRQTRHSRVQHLITADETSLVELETLLATLPICSTGRVFIEVADAGQIVPLDVPARMTLTWLDRSQRSGEPGSGKGCVAGTALRRAVTAWADEMLCAEDDATRIHLLGGYLGTADIVDHLTEQLHIGAEAIHAPERFGLLTSR